jgi:ATP-dependent Clp protease ATP-binding subunit ClpA
VDRLGRDLSELARNGSLSPVIGRKDEMRSLVQTLLRSRKNNAILIGEAGVGKTGVVEGLAQRIADGSVPPEFARISSRAFKRPIDLFDSTRSSWEAIARLRFTLKIKRKPAQRSASTIDFIDSPMAPVTTTSRAVFCF